MQPREDDLGNITIDMSFAASEPYKRQRDAAALGLRAGEAQDPISAVLFTDGGRAYVASSLTRVCTSPDRVSLPINAACRHPVPQ